MCIAPPENFITLSSTPYTNTGLYLYSRLPIIRTFKGNRKKFELAGVPVIEGNYMERDLKGNENYFELTGGSSYRESTVLCILYFS